MLVTSEPRWLAGRIRFIVCAQKSGNHVFLGMHNSGTMHTRAKCFIVMVVTCGRHVSQRDYEKAVNVISVDSHAHKYAERNQLSTTMWKILRWDEQLHKGRDVLSSANRRERDGSAFRLIKPFFPPNKWRSCAEFQAAGIRKGQLLKRMRSIFLLETNSNCPRHESGFASIYAPSHELKRGTTVSSLNVPNCSCNFASNGRWINERWSYYFVTYRRWKSFNSTIVW